MKYMKSVLLVTLLLISSAILAQRNVILIIADDVGTDYFGFSEDHADTVATPNISKLLSRGVRFQNAMSNPVCSPTRSGILTGRYSFRTGVGNVVGGIGGSGQLDTAEITIPRLLNIYNPGIATAQIGKWHLQSSTPTVNLLNPNRMGFDYFAGNFSGAIANYYNWTKVTNGVSSTVTNYATIETTNDAVSWIKTQNNNPFFLCMAYNAPHSPYHLPPSGMYSDTSLSGTPMDINANPKKYFKASLEALDFEIGRIFDSLQVLNLMDSTDIIFIGDNGNAVQTAQIANKTKSKGTIYQYGVHVPFIISGPSVVNPGRVSSELVNTVDLFSTILELFGDTTWSANIPLNKPVDSKSIMSVILNQTSSVRPWAFTEIFKMTPDSSDGKAMRNMEFKLLNFDDGHQEFYKLANDSLELNNLLTGTLSGIDIINYQYLCNEMTSLVGTGTFCSTVNIQNLDNNDFIKVFPNPFTSHIYYQSSLLYYKYELRNCFGQLVSSGTDINSRDFSRLADGIYFLTISDVQTKTIKVIKKQ